MVRRDELQTARAEQPSLVAIHPCERFTGATGNKSSRTVEIAPRDADRSGSGEAQQQLAPKGVISLWRTRFPDSSARRRDTKPFILQKSSKIESQRKCKVSRFHNRVLDALDGLSRQVLFPFCRSVAVARFFEEKRVSSFVYVPKYDVFFGASVSWRSSNAMSPSVWDCMCRRTCSSRSTSFFHRKLIGFMTEASWPPLHNKQNQCSSVTHKHFATRMSKVPLLP